MSELTARLGIYGSIDRAVGAGRLSIERVSQYLAPYGFDTPGTAPAVGWYDSLNELTQGSLMELNSDLSRRIQSSASDDSDSSTSGSGYRPERFAVDETAAIEALAEISEVSEIDAEHRLRALFLAAQLLEVPTDPGSTLVAALVPIVASGRADADELRADADESRWRQASATLGEMLSDQGRYQGLAGYLDLVAQAHDEDLVSEITRRLSRVSCDEATKSFVDPTSGRQEVAAVVVSRVEVSCPELDVEELRSKFHPGRWPECLPTFWGQMDPLAPPYPDLPDPENDPGETVFVYREHVGDQSRSSSWFKPVLEFWYEPLWDRKDGKPEVNGFALRYQLAPKLPPDVVQDIRILVDDGSLTVERVPLGDKTMKVFAGTYKMLAMRHPLPSAGLAIFACASGWADQAKALVTGCLFHGGDT